MKGKKILFDNDSSGKTERVLLVSFDPCQRELKEKMGKYF
jgi:hypothetical protein